MRLRQDRVELSVPATATGLSGPPAHLALALGLHDRYVINAVAGHTRVLSYGLTGSFDPNTGEPTEEPTGETHPTIRGIRAGLDHFDASQVGVELHLQAGIPRGRGLGATSAGILAGLVAAHGLLDVPVEPQLVTELAVSLGAERVRVQAALAGGVVVALDPERPALSLRPRPELAPVAFVPDFARVGELPSPARLSPEAAGREAARLAWLALLLGNGDLPVELLLAATEDPVLLPAWAGAVPASHALIGWLRENGVVATLTGTGPTVLSLTAVSETLREAARRSGWLVMETEAATTALRCDFAPKL